MSDQDPAVPDLKPYEVMPYVLALWNLADMAEPEAKAFEVALANIDPRTATRRSHLRLYTRFYVIMAMGTSASRILWPTKKSRDEKGLSRPAARERSEWRLSRGDAVRTALGVLDADFPALMDRDLRNAIEHFDEQIDGLVRESFTGAVADLSVYPDDLVVTSSGAALEMRRIDPHTGVARIGGSLQLDVRAMIAELRDLRTRAAAWLDSQP